jgi:hypothetical protein
MINSKKYKTIEISKRLRTIRISKQLSLNDKSAIMLVVHTTYSNLQHLKSNIIIKPWEIKHHIYGTPTSIVYSKNYYGPSLITYSRHRYKHEPSNKFYVTFSISSCYYELTSEVCTESKSEFEKYKLKNKLKNYKTNFK